MTPSSNQPSMLRRALLAVGAMLGASAIFVTACMLLVVAVLDRAVPPKSPASDFADVAEATGEQRSPAVAPRQGHAPRAGSSDTRS